MHRVGFIALVLAACSGGVDDAARKVTGGGDPERGRQAVRRLGCGSCHTIPTVPGAVATVGPSLSKLSMRAIVAGRLPNTIENVMQWVQHPRHLQPGTAMPEMNVSDEDARDIAALLYTLR